MSPLAALVALIVTSAGFANLGNSGTPGIDVHILAHERVMWPVKKIEISYGDEEVHPTETALQNLNISIGKSLFLLQRVRGIYSRLDTKRYRVRSTTGEKRHHLAAVRIAQDGHSAQNGDPARWRLARIDQVNYGRCLGANGEALKAPHDNFDVWPCLKSDRVPGVLKLVAGNTNPLLGNIDGRLEGVHLIPRSLRLGLGRIGQGLGRDNLFFDEATSGVCLPPLQTGEDTRSDGSNSGHAGERDDGPCRLVGGIALMGMMAAAVTAGIMLFVYSRRKLPGTTFGALLFLLGSALTFGAAVCFAGL